jgi:hypothetical protein
MRAVLERFAANTVIVEGEAPGADTMARIIGQELGFDVRPYPANWEGMAALGLPRGAAGPLRNQEMLDKEWPIDLVAAFHDRIWESKGTADMLKRADKANVPVRLYTYAYLALGAR